MEIFQPGPSEYLEMGFKAIRLKGYHHKFNKQRDYKIAKQPVDKGFTKIDFKCLSLLEIEQAEKQGFWIGWLVPEGYIVIDSEDPLVIKILNTIAKDTNCSVQKTNRGKQYIFRCENKKIPAASEYFCAGGFPVTPRVAGKNYVIMPPTNSRSWEQWIFPDKLPQIQDLLLPYDPKEKEQIALCLAWQVGEEYRKGSLAGWEDIDCSFMAYLFENNLSIDLIQNCFQHVFIDNYDQKRTEEMYIRVKKLKENGEKILGSGSFAKKIKDINLNNIMRFFSPFSTNEKTLNNTEERKTRPSLAHELIHIAEQFYLFNDSSVGYAWINNEVYSIQGPAFRNFITHELYLSKKKIAGSEIVKQALSVIEGKALHEGKSIELHNRVTSHEGAFYYDMGSGRAIKITTSGWIIDNSPPILFKRYNHQAPQVDPKKGGKLDVIFNFMNVMNAQDQLLFKVIIVSLFVPGIIHPLIFLFGGQGTGKTKGSHFIKKLIDPSRLDVFIPPHNRAELIQSMEHHYFCVFDNLSYIQDWFSDILSIAVTGGGQSKRKLYTDDEDVIFSFKRCIAITAINMCITKSDLFDRTILIELDRITPEQRKEESKMIQEFEAAKPRILGTIFDVLSTAMKIYPDIEVKHLPRMADFCRWGCAIAEALGYKKNDFLKAYNENIHKQHYEIINGSTLAQAIIIFMKNRPHWTGLVGDFYDELKKLVRVTIGDKTFPTYSNKLRAYIERIKPNLKEAGIDVFIADSHCQYGTPITIRKTQQGNLTEKKMGDVSQTVQ